MGKKKLFKRFIANALILTMVFAESNLTAFAVEGGFSKETAIESVIPETVDHVIADTEAENGSLISEKNTQEYIVEDAEEEVSMLDAVNADTVSSGDADGVIAQGSKCGIDWVIDAEGTLTISGTYTGGEFNDSYFIFTYWYDFYDEEKEGWSTTYGPVPEWIGYMSDIKNVVVKAKGIESTEGWFLGCKYIVNFDFDEFDTSAVTTMRNMFRGTSSTFLDVTKFDTGNVMDMSGMFGDCRSLENLDVSKFDTSNVMDMSGMFGDCRSLENLDVSKFDTSNVMDMSGMFGDCRSLKNLDVSKFDTSNVTNMSGMFCLGDYDYDHSSLTSLDVSKFDTSKVTNMSDMFGYCTLLEKMDISKFDTSNVTDMSGMFYGCKSLENLDVSKFDTSNVMDMSGMFGYCRSLKSLDVSKFDTSNVTDMSWMFETCQSLTNLDVSKFDTSNVTNMSGMFYLGDYKYEYSSLTSLDVSKFDTSKVTNMSGMFGYCTLLENLDVSKFDTSKVTFMSNMFYGCESLTNLDVSKFDTSKVTNMGGMFYICKRLENLDVSKFDTSNVTDMHIMFGHCRFLKSLDVSKFDTSKVTDMSGMFHVCESLKRLNIGNFNTSKVTDMSGMFSYCSSLTNLDTSSFDTSEVTSMDAMFNNCKSLERLDVNSFNTSNVMNMSWMFCDCSSLTSLDVSNFDTSKVTDMSRMFYGCVELKAELDVSNFDTSKAMNMSEMFGECTELKTIKTFKGLTKDISLPVTPMYDSKGNEYTNFPTGLSEGIWLSTDPNNVPDNSINRTSATIDIASAGIVVYDRKTQEPIEGASIEIDGTTYSSRKMVSVPLASAQVQKTITVTADGYCKSTSKPTLEKGKITYISLTPKAASEDGVAITAVDAGYGTKIYRLLDQTMNLTYLPGLDKSKATMDTMTIAVFAEGKVSKYELLQDSEVLQTSTDGRFSLDIIQKYDSDTYVSMVTTDLKNKKALYVRVTGTDGTQVKEKLGVKISGSYVSTGTQSQTGKFSVGKKLELNVPDDVPLIGGGKCEIGLDENIPVEVSIDEKGIVKVAFKRDIQSIDKFGDDYKNLSKRALNRIDAAKALGGTPQNFGCGFFKVTGKLCGYGEGNLSELNNGKLIVSVGVLAEMEGKGGYKQYFLAGWVPVFLYVEGSAKVSVDAKGSLAWENFKLTGFQLIDGSITLQAKVTVGGGVGVEVLTALKASVEGTLNYENKPQRNYEKVWLTASGKVSQVSLVFIETVYWESKQYKYTVYEKGKDESPLETKSIAGLKVEDLEPVTQILSRNYLAYEDGYQKLAEPVNVQAVSDNAALSRKVVKGAVLPSAEPKLVQVGTKKYLFWLDDITTRSAMNRAALVYAVSEDGINWSEPKQLISEDVNGTLDYGFQLVVAGNKIYIAWQDATQTYAEDADLLCLIRLPGQ